MSWPRNQSIPGHDAARVRLTHHYHTRSIQDSDVEALLSATMVAR